MSNKQPQNKHKHKKVSFDPKSANSKPSLQQYKPFEEGESFVTLTLDQLNKLTNVKSQMDKTDKTP